MYTCRENELSVYCASDMTVSSENLTVIDLSQQFNHTFDADFDVRLGGGRFFDKEERF